MLLPIEVHDDARIALLVRARVIAEGRGALIAQIVFPAIGGGVPFAAFEQDDAESAAPASSLADDAAAGARPRSQHSHV